MKIFKALIVVTITLLLIWALQTKFGALPAFGKLLNPTSGFWQNAESKHTPKKSVLKDQDLLEPVTIEYDHYMIPHIFANNDHDLYFAQGFVTARDRLWQMDIQTRSASGRLAEIAGSKALEIDRYHRRMGMVYGAEKTIAGMMKNPKIKIVIEAYTAGINAYIHQLSPKDYPIEFKLLDYAPEDWKPINCALLLKLMSETLAGGSDDFAMTNTLKHFGAAVTKDLFPDYPFRETPVIPEGTKWDFSPLPIPQPSKSFIAETNSEVKSKEKVEGVGSNNWAISGSKSTTGYPMLANDPHLNLTLPAIWYQLQLISPDVNVYGVSIPGAPCVIIGYNQKIGWGVTNVDADVLDWYQVKFKDASKKEYWYKNKWNTVSRRVEIINVRNAQPVSDTVTYTHHGPVVYEQKSSKPEKFNQAAIVPVGSALRWIAHDESEDITTFYLLNRSKNYADYREALTHYTAPAQNFIFASVDKDIAITPNGKMPLKYKDQGKFILDGSDPADDWQGWIPMDQNPTVKNPARGFVSSANQSSTDQLYPYYINWQFSPYERAKRINDRLTVMQNATVDSLRMLQNDTYSILAQDILPTMLADLEPSKMEDNQKAALEMVTNWNKKYEAGSIAASIFDLWWDRLYNGIWSDDFISKDPNIELRLPSRDRTVKMLLLEKNAYWFDRQQTPQTESRADLINRAFDVAVDSLIRKFGKPGKAWEWGMIKGSHIAHLANIDGFGSGKFSAGGSGSTVNALSATHGPSWRMVLQFGPTVKGYGIFPGGESGNPGSFYYDNLLHTWQDGKLNELLFLKSPGKLPKQIKSTLILSKN